MGVHMSDVWNSIKKVRSILGSENGRKCLFFWLGFICLFVCFIIRKLEAADSVCLSWLLLSEDD